MQKSFNYDNECVRIARMAQAHNLEQEANQRHLLERFRQADQQEESVLAGICGAILGWQADLPITECWRLQTGGK